MLSPGVAWNCRAWENWLFHRAFIPKVGSLTEKAAFLCSKQKLSWRNWKACYRRSCYAGATKTLPVAIQEDRGICCRPRWNLRDARDARDKRYSFNEACSRMRTLSSLWPHVWLCAVCAPSGRCLVVGGAKTPAGHSLGLASPEPDTGVGISLVSSLQTMKLKKGHKSGDSQFVDSGKIS